METRRPRIAAHGAVCNSHCARVVNAAAVDTGSPEPFAIVRSEMMTLLPEVIAKMRK